VMSTLKEWKLACPRRDAGKKAASGEPIKELYLVFPNGNGKVELLPNLRRRQWHPLQLAAGVAVPREDKGKLVMVPKYPGLHALRHFYCSWCAARPQDGGLGLPLKTVQVRMGHATLSMTADTYGHLFPSQDDAEVLAAGEAALMRA
jgi:integrase